MRNTTTHFELVPVELVKKIADKEFPEKKASRNEKTVMVSRPKTMSHSTGAGRVLRKKH
jgi:hypothetical protein